MDDEASDEIEYATEGGPLLKAGSWKAIRFEARNGDIFTVLDELLHALDWVHPLGNAHWRWRFCQWAHLRNEPGWQAGRKRQ